MEDEAQGQGEGHGHRRRRSSGNSSPNRKEGAEALAALDARYKQCQREGRQLDALACLRRACVLREESFGAEHRRTQQARENFIICSNIVAAKLLRQGDGEQSCKLLLSAYDFTNRSAEGRARAATIANIATCMYGKELLAESVHYLSLLQGSPYFRGERHLTLCASLFKLGKRQQALFHAQSAVHFAQEEAAHCFREAALPACFRAEALMVLCLAYHALGTTLSADAHRFVWSLDVDVRQRGVLLALQGVQWLTRAYEDVAVANAWAIPAGLRSAVWHSLLSACQKCYPPVAGALTRGEVSGNLTVAVHVRKHVSASKLQRSMRTYLLRKESTAAVQIQRGTRRYLDSRRQSTAAVRVQSYYRGRSARLRLLAQGRRGESDDDEGDQDGDVTESKDERVEHLQSGPETDDAKSKKRTFWKTKKTNLSNANIAKAAKPRRNKFKKKTKAMKTRKGSGIFRSAKSKVKPAA